MSPPATLPQPIGQLALHQMLGLEVPLPAVRSYVVQGARRSEREGAITVELYPPQWTPLPTPLGHLKFALKHEAYDLRLLNAALRAIPKTSLQDWVRSEPTGSYARRAWFLYEYFSDQTLDLPDVKAGNYVELLNKERHYTNPAPQRSSRQRILNNLLGTPLLCPFVRRTAKLLQMQQLGLGHKALALSERYGDTLARAVDHLYTQETRSSFELEGQSPNPTRLERFVKILKKAAEFVVSKDSLITLQGSMVDPRYAAKDYRDFQNFVGETNGSYGQHVHFICPRPEDVPSLMQGWLELNPKLYSFEDPVIAAAVSAFALVFIHPFEDGNGRIHRFLIHHFLSKSQFSKGVIFPVSAAILRDKGRYDQVLEDFSKPLFDHVQWDFTKEGGVVVHNHTHHLYRIFDATAQAEYLYDRVKETIEIDLLQELDFLAVFDRAMQAVREIVDMPDRRASLFIRLCLQNGGRLSRAKRDQFSELSDTEVTHLEAAVQSAMALL